MIIHDITDPVASGDIAERMGVRARNINLWRKMYRTFPQPILTIQDTPIWEWAAIADWARSNGFPIRNY